MIYPIVKYGQSVLETPGQPVTEFDDKLKKLVEDMFQSMYAAHGVGLAAPQIGLGLRLAVVDISFKEDPNSKLVLCNPTIVNIEGKQTGEEGCLSIPEFREKVTRPRQVMVRAQDENGEWRDYTGEDLLARALMHEIDHLDGRLYIHHISGLKRDLMRRKIRKLQRAGEW
jgi:peptide deformylase